MKRQKVLTFESCGLLKIRVQDVVENDGWKFGRFELRPTEERIELYKNDEYQKCWRLSCLEIPQLPPILNREDKSFKCNRSPAMVFMIYGKDGLRYRYLYSDGQLYFDTRTDLGIRYTINCLSRRQRKEDEIIKLKRLVRRNKWLRKERKERRQLAKIY